ncbi:MAG: DctP family TRAP transporter solute-binding subunit [Arenicella sp.]
MLTIKKIGSLCLCSLIFIATTVYSQPLTIRFSYDVEPDTPKGKMAERFKMLVEQHFKNTIIVELYPDKQLYGDETVLEEMLAGNVELAAPPLTQFKSYSRRLQLFDLPFLFVNQRAAQRFLSGVYGERLSNTLKNKGFIGLGFLDNGMKQLSASKKLYFPSDAAGLKFRIMDSDVLEQQFVQINAIALRKPFSEVFALLESQGVDGQENTWSNIYTKKFYQAQPYIIESNHGYLGYMIVSSNEFWGSLSSSMQSKLKALLDEAIEYGNQVANQKAGQDRQAVIDSGVTEVYSLSPDQRQIWVETMQQVWAKFEDQIGTELIKAAASQR